MRTLEEIKAEASELCKQIGVETVNYQSKLNRVLNQIAKLEKEAAKTKEVTDEFEKLKEREVGIRNTEETMDNSAV